MAAVFLYAVYHPGCQHGALSSKQRKVSPANPASMRRMLSIVALSSLAAVSSALRLRATATVRHSQPRCQFTTGKGEPVDDDKSQRRQNLKDLFGEQAADRLAPLTKTERAEAQVDEILMLQEGMQRLSWGGIRLVDVDMAPGPLELALEPLEPTGSSLLLCARLDMPLGLLLEEEPNPDPSPNMPNVVRGNPDP